MSDIRTTEGKLQIPRIFISKPVQTSQSQGQMSFINASRTSSLPHIHVPLSDNRRMLTSYKTCELINFNLNSKSGVSDIHNGQGRLWTKVTDTRALPLLCVKVNEKRLSLGLEIGENAAKRYYSKRKLRLHVYPFQKKLLARFKLAVKLTIFCSKQFKEHCLRYVCFSFRYKMCVVCCSHDNW